ncbi:MAG: hypothetical protein CVV64_16295 [Candidatus Wallbacteria bacterium HGW-Wallbacteria-1]|jgi:PAS domain S-box-containing protein|uniref:histidine kinase n=1 Tax=Candidatus Wallbacteria bacterium HGW-Wallbacteria-1 TaxID=2013854 RepID=A0A2N1PKW3_9BACT|nr:MAG: hypothetical protein CVV64_16295 [Candidatus Wallbacteria bacterium HGW-Wallbacteria-1]
MAAFLENSISSSLNSAAFLNAANYFHNLARITEQYYHCDATSQIMNEAISSLIMATDSNEGFIFLPLSESSESPQAKFKSLLWKNDHFSENTDLEIIRLITSSESESSSDPLCTDSQNWTWSSGLCPISERGQLFWLSMAHNNLKDDSIIRSQAFCGVILSLGNQDSHFQNALVSNLGQLGKLYTASRREFLEMMCLQKSERKYRTYLNHSKDLIWAADMQFNFQYMSPAIMELRGYTPEETMKQPLHEMYTPESTQTIMEAYMQCMEALAINPDFKGPEHGIECQAYCRDGSLKWIEVNAHFYRDENGIVSGFVGNSRDINARKMIETELKYHLEFEKLVTNLASDFITMPVEHINASIQEALRKVGEYAQVDSDWIFMLSQEGSLASLESQWLAPETPDTMDQWQNIRTSDYPFFIDQLVNNGILAVSSLDQIPSEGDSLHEFLSTMGVSSFISAPMIINGDFIGFMGMDCKNSSREWSDEIRTIVKISAHIFANAIARLRTETELANYRNNLETLVRERTAELLEANNALQTEILSRKEAESKLLESELRFQDIFESTDECITVWDVDCNVLYMNGSARNQFSKWKIEAPLARDTKDSGFTKETGYTKDIGYTKETCIDQTLNIKQIFRDFPDLMFAWEHRISTVFSSSQPCSRENVINIKNETRYLESTFFPIRDSRNQAFAVGTVFRDVTERKMLEEELFNSRKIESLGVFAGGIAHDFNNLITVITGSLQLAKMHIAPDHKAFRQIERAEKGAFRCKDIATQFLTFARGGAPIRKTSSIAELIQDCSTLGISGTNANLELHLDNLSPVDIDQGQISQVINNLILNSIQAMPEGGTITIRGRNIVITEPDQLPVRPGRYVQISISDHGKGISGNLKTKIFEPFFTTKENGKGLGLALSHSIIRKHNGYITLVSSEGMGTTFNIFLPQSAGEIPFECITPNEMVRGTGKILVMDDEEDIRINLKSILTDLGYDVEVARDGNEALLIFHRARISDEPFDAVILDLTVPAGMGGRKTMRKLLKIDPEVKAIVSSGYSNDPIMSDYRTHGFSGILFKPYLMEEMSRVVHDVVERGSQKLRKSDNIHE